MPGRLKSDAPLLGLLLAAVLLLFWPVLLNPRLVLYPTFSPFSDLMVIHWPKALLMAQSWQAGEGLPYWTPLILSGMPLAADQLAMLFYPPAWLFLFLPLEIVFNLLFIGHLLLGGAGIYFLLRAGFGVSRGAALLGGLAFALNGKWLAHVAGGHVSMVGAIGWLPWALLGMHQLLRTTFTGPAQAARPEFNRAGPGWALLTAVAVAMQIVTHTLPTIYTAYILLGMAGWHLVTRLPWRAPKTALRPALRLLIYLAAIFLLAGLLGAWQLLPLLELAEYSNRSLSLSQAAEFSMTPAQLLIGLLLPNARGGHELVIYLGLIPLLLAPLGVTAKNRWSWFYAGLLLLAVAFALGPATPVHRFFYYLVPGFGWVRTPARAFFVAALAAAILAGWAADRLQKERWSPAAKGWLTRLAVALSALALLLGLGLAVGFGQTNRATLTLAVVVPAGLGLIMLRLNRLMSAPVTTALLGLLLVIDLAWFDMSMMRFVPLADALAPGRPAAQYLSQQPGLFRVYSPSYSLPTQTAATHGLFLADGVEPVHLAVYDQFMARAGGYHDSGFSVTIPHFGSAPPETALKEVQPDLKLLGLLNVRYLAAEFPMTWPGLALATQVGGTYIYTNSLGLPRAWVVHQTEPAAVDWLSQLETLPDLGRVALISEDAPPLSLDRPPTPVTVAHFSPDRLELETSLDAPGWLVLSEIWYPGWQATVNGAPRPVERVNGLLRGVYLPQPDDYHIELVYRPYAARF